MLVLAIQIDNASADSVLNVCHNILCVPDQLLSGHAFPIVNTVIFSYLRKQKGRGSKRIGIGIQPRMRRNLPADSIADMVIFNLNGFVGQCEIANNLSVIFIKNKICNSNFAHRF